MISFRASDKDIANIEAYKKRMGQGIRVITDSEAIRAGLEALQRKVPEPMKDASMGLSINPNAI